MELGRVKHYQKTFYIRCYLHDCSRLSEDVVDGVQGHPDHGREAHAHAHVLGPLRVDVVLAVLHRLVGDHVEDEHGLRRQHWRHTKQTNK